MQQLIGDHPGISCDSAGTSGYHQGEWPDSRMHAALEKRGYQHRSRSRQVTTEDFHHFDLILAMDRENHRNLQLICPDPALLEKLKLMCEYCEEHRLEEVPDPYYGGLNGFSQVIDLLEDACQGLWKSLQRT